MSLPVSYTLLADERLQTSPEHTASDFERRSSYFALRSDHVPRRPSLIVMGGIFIK